MSLLSLPYTVAALDFIDVACEHEYTIYNPQRKLRSGLPLASLWRQPIESILIAHGLLKPHYFGNVYWNALDLRYCGENGKERVDSFFKLKIRQPELQAVNEKLLQLADFEKQRQKMGVEKRVTLSKPKLTSEQEAELLKRLKKFGSKANSVLECENEVGNNYPTITRDDILNNVTPKKAYSQWPCIGIGAIYLVYIISRRLGK